MRIEFVIEFSPYLLFLRRLPLRKPLDSRGKGVGGRDMGVGGRDMGVGGRDMGWGRGERKGGRVRGEWWEGGKGGEGSERQVR